MGFKITATSDVSGKGLKGAPKTADPALVTAAIVGIVEDGFFVLPGGPSASDTGTPGHQVKVGVEGRIWPDGKPDKAQAILSQVRTVAHWSARFTALHDGSGLTKADGTAYAEDPKNGVRDAAIARDVARLLGVKDLAQLGAEDLYVTVLTPYAGVDLTPVLPA